MIKKILVTGADGQLGRSLRKIAVNYPDFKFYFTDIGNLDITKFVEISAFIAANKIDIIINCAAYTAVDLAESDVETAYLINDQAVEYLALLSREFNLLLIHVSTDYVFDGQSYRPYTEDMPVDPVSVYGKSKLAGEQAIVGAGIKAVIIRTSWLYSEFGHNFVKTMLNLGEQRDLLNVVADQIGTPTYAEDLARAILIILTKINSDNINNLSGIYHYSNEGVASWYDFAISVMEFAQRPCKVMPLKSEAYKTAARRPFYSVLDKGKIRNSFDLEIPYWRDSLIKCLKVIR